MRRITHLIKEISSTIPHKNILRFVGVLTTILVLICGSIQQAIFAQPNQLTPVYIGGDFGDVAWSNDGQQFVFTEATERSAVQLASPDWVDYDTESHTISSNDVWPLQPTLTGQELELFAPLVGHQLSFIYESPNQRYLVFARGEEVSSLMLADRLTNQVVTVSPELPIPDPASGPDSFRILFSADSSAFTVMYATDFSDEYGIDYVSGYTSDISGAVRIIIGDFGQNLRASSRLVEDISSNGNLVLLTGTPTSPFSNERHLFLWDATTLNSIDISGLQEQEIKGVAFSPQSENNLLVVTRTGLIQYDRSTTRITQHRNDITSDWVSEAYFSPSAEYVALTKEDGSHKELYIIDLRAELPPTLTATNTVNSPSETELPTPTATFTGFAGGKPLH